MHKCSRCKKELIVPIWKRCNECDKEVLKKKRLAYYHKYKNLLKRRIRDQQVRDRKLKEKQLSDELLAVLRESMLRSKLSTGDTCNNQTDRIQ